MDSLNRLFLNLYGIFAYLFSKTWYIFLYDVGFTMFQYVSSTFSSWVMVIPTYHICVRAVSKGATLHPLTTDLTSVSCETVALGIRLEQKISGSPNATNATADRGIQQKFVVWLEGQLSNEKKGPWLVRIYRGWNPSQFYRDFNKPL